MGQAASANIISEATQLLPGLPRRCLVAIYRISAPHSAAALVLAATNVQSLLRAHHWLGTDLDPYYPELKLLPGKDLPHLRQDPYPAGSTSQILRALLTASDPSTRSLQALLISISARYHAILPNDQLYPARPDSANSPILSAYRAITCLADVICGYENFPRRSELLRILMRADGSSIDSDSQSRPSTAQEYALALVYELERNPTIHRTLYKARRSILSALDIAPPPKRTKRRPGRKRLRIPEDESITIALPQIRNLDESEPLEEGQARVDAGRTPDSKHSQSNLSSLKQAMRACEREQRIRHTNPWLCPDHIAVLSQAESESFCEISVKSAAELLKTSDTEQASALAAANLILATGFTLDRTLGLFQKPSAPGKSLVLADDCSSIGIPILRPARQFRPDSASESMLVVPADTWTMPLPPKVSNLLNETKTALSQITSVPELQSRINIALDQLANLEPLLSALSIGRIRRTPAARLYAECRDISAVQTILRDSFGPMDAALYYFGAAIGDLRRTYCSAMWPLWEGKDGPNQCSETASDRVWIGSAARPEVEALGTLHSKITARFHASRTASSGKTGTIDRHNRMVSHTATMLMSIAGHRPAQSLFDLSIHDFDLNRRLGLFRDKAVDAGHLVRPAALGQTLTNQLRLFDLHLRALAKSKDLPPGVGKVVAKTLSGRMPLFWLLDPQGRRLSGTLERIRQYWPDELKALPNNYGRHLIGSIVRREVDHPEYIHMQLGHFHACDYPLSPDSPTTLERFEGEISPALDDLACDQGWKLQSGLARTRLRSKKTHMSWSETGPLTFWKRRNESAHALAKQHSKKLKLAARAKLRHVRDEAETLICNCAKELSPVSYSLVNSCLRSEDKPLEMGYYTEEDVGYSNLVEAIEFASAERTDLQLAALLALRKALLRASKQDLYRGRVPGLPFLSNSVDPTPFLTQHFRSTRQMDMLRRHFRKTGLDEKRWPEDKRDLLLAGKTALTLILFAGIDDHELLMAILSPDSRIIGLPPIPDSILVLLPGISRTPGFRQIAAIAIARWKRSKASEQDWTSTQISDALQRLLPRDCYRKNSNILRSLLDLSWAVNQVEDAPIANLALDGAAGSTDLRSDRLKDLLSASSTSYPHPERQKPIEIEKHQSTGKSDKELRKQYLQLVACWPNKDVDIHLSESNQVIKLGQRTDPSSIHKIKTEMALIAGSQDYHPLIRYLASWMNSDIRRDKKRGHGKIQIGTSFASLKAIGPKLVKTFSGNRASAHLLASSRIDTEELESAYIDVLDATRDHQLSETLQAIQDFHGHLVEAFDLEPIDEALFYQFYQAAERAPRVPRAEIPLPWEVLPAQKMLDEIHNDPDHFGVDGLLASQTRTIAQMLLLTGARINEIIGLTLRDVLTTSNAFYFLIRRTGYRTVKSSAAIRIIGSDSLQPGELTDLKLHIQGTSGLHAERQAHRAYLFSQDDRSPTGYTSVSVILRSILASASPVQLTIHSIRHLFYCEELLRLWIGLSIKELADPVSTGKISPPQLPWDLRSLLVRVGHGKARVGIQSYFHFSWMFMLARQSSPIHQCDRHAFAAAAGITLSGADYHGSNGWAKGVSDYLDHFWIRKPDSDFLVDIETPVAGGRGLPRLCLAAFRVATGMDSKAACHRYSVHEKEWEAILNANQIVAAKTGINLFDEHPDNVRQSRLPIFIREALPLRILWERVEAERIDGEIERAIISWLTFCAKSDRGRLSAPKVDIDDINKILTSTEWHAAIKKQTEGPFQNYDIKHRSSGKSANHVWAYFLTITACVRIARRSLA